MGHDDSKKDLEFSEEELADLKQGLENRSSTSKKGRPRRKTRRVLKQQFKAAQSSKWQDQKTVVDEIDPHLQPAQPKDPNVTTESLPMETTDSSVPADKHETSSTDETLPTSKESEDQVLWRAENIPTAKIELFDKTEPDQVKPPSFPEIPISVTDPQIESEKNLAPYMMDGEGDFDEMVSDDEDITEVTVREDPEDKEEAAVTDVGEVFQKINQHEMPSSAVVTDGESENMSLTLPDQEAAKTLTDAIQVEEEGSQDAIADSPTERITVEVPRIRDESKPNDFDDSVDDRTPATQSIFAEDQEAHEPKVESALPDNGEVGESKDLEHEEGDDTLELPSQVVRKAVHEALIAATETVSTQQDNLGNTDFDIDDPSFAGATQALEELSERFRSESKVSTGAKEGEEDEERANRVAILLSALKVPVQKEKTKAPAEDKQQSLEVTAKAVPIPPKEEVEDEESPFSEHPSVELELDFDDQEAESQAAEHSGELEELSTEELEEVAQDEEPLQEEGSSLPPPIPESSLSPFEMEQEKVDQVVRLPLPKDLDEGDEIMTSAPPLGAPDSSSTIPSIPANRGEGEMPAPVPPSEDALPDESQQPQVQKPPAVSPARKTHKPPPSPQTSTPESNRDVPAALQIGKSTAPFLNQHT